MNRETKIDYINTLREEIKDINPRRKEIKNEEITKTILKYILYFFILMIIMKGMGA